MVNTTGTNTLEIAFESRTLRTLCESAPEATAQLGDAVAQLLRHRLADLRAVTTPRDVVAGRLHTVDDDYQMTIELCAGYRLVFAPNHLDNPMTPDKKVDWQRVSRIKLLRIENYDADE